VYPLECLFHFFILDYRISFVAPKGDNECLGSVERESKKEGNRVEKTKRRERRKGKKIVEELLEQLGQFSLNHLHQGHPLYFEKVMRVLGKKET
jgi:hypothetical protein